jgi:hypothetical protein
VTVAIANERILGIAGNEVRLRGASMARAASGHGQPQRITKA